MSYILEALKKAQAERQLGNAPTVHAPQPVPAVQPGAAASRRPLFIGLGAGALVAAGAALLMWHRGPAPAPAAPAAPLAATVPAVTAASNRLEVSAPPTPATPPAPAMPPPRVARVPAAPPPAPAPAPAPPLPAGAGRAGTTPREGGGALASTAPERRAAAASAVPAAVPPRTVAAPAPAPSPEDSLPYLHQLPDAVQGGLPRVSFGGYMYSANPADRLLLVDKTLRHEGEEVAPGLVLEKLLPKAAVMNYRGVRYRVAY